MPNIVLAIIGLVLFLKAADIITQPEQTPASVVMAAALVLGAAGQFMAQDDSQRALIGYLTCMYSAGILALVSIFLAALGSI